MKKDEVFLKVVSYCLSNNPEMIFVLLALSDSISSLKMSSRMNRVFCLDSMLFSENQKKLELKQKTQTFLARL
jgi:hypothetical protein